MLKPLVRGLLTAVLAMTVAAESRAQQRSGLVGGISLGAGALGLHGRAGDDPAIELIRQADDQVPVMGFDVHLGAMVGPRTAVLFAMTGDLDLGSESDLDAEVRVGERAIAFSSSTTSLGSGVFAGALQHWLTSNIWVRGGLGVGFLTRDFTLGSDASYLMLTLDRGYGLAVLAATGVELRRWGNFAVDLEFHLTAVGLNGLGIYAPTVQVGCNWY